MDEKTVDININNRWYPASERSIKKGDIFRIVKGNGYVCCKALADAAPAGEGKYLIRRTIISTKERN